MTETQSRRSAPAPARLGALALAAALATILARPAAAEAPDFAADGTLTVCTTAGYPPLSYKNDPADPRPVGIDIELIEALAAGWGATVAYVETDFPGLLPSLGSGRCEAVISGIYVTDKRREVYDGARYMKSATVILVKGDNTDINAPEDLSGKLLALESGAYYGEERVKPLNEALVAAGKAPVATQDYPGQSAATQQVLIGRADATLTEEAEGAFRIAQAPGTLRIAHTYPSGFTFGIYIQRDPTAFAQLKAGLKDLAASGFFGTLAAKYGLDPSVFDVDHES